MDLYEKFDIELEPAEVLDRVDEMLVWQAIAAEGKDLAYTWRDFLRADPMIRVDEHAYGRLAPRRVAVVDSAEFAAQPVDDRMAQTITRNARMQDLFTKNLPDFIDGLGERLCFAEMTEHLDHDQVHVNLRSHKVPSSLRGFMVHDVGDLFRQVKFHIHSTSEVTGQDAGWWRRAMRAPQIARVFKREEVAVFKNGESGSGLQLWGWWGGRFWTANPSGSGAPVPAGHEIDGHYADIVSDMIGDAWASQERRRGEWVVELSLGEKRTGIGLPTDADGARELVNVLRGDDSSNGRRASLVHWVGEHMRRSRRRSADSHLVRAHLRGKQVLRAGRYAVRIWPSRIDIETACNGKRFDRDREAVGGRA